MKTLTNFFSPFTPYERTEFRLGDVLIVVTPDLPRMQLSKHVCEVLSPNVIEQTNAWLLDFFGSDNVLNDGDAVIVERKMYMNPRMFEKFKQAVSADVFNLADYRR